MAASSSSPSSIGLEGELTALGGLRRRIAPLLPAGSTQGEPPLVLVTALLDIHPPEVDRQFWQSATWRKSVRSLDMAYFAFVVTNNSALLLHRRRWPMEKFPFAGGFTALFLLLSFLQSYGSYRSHPLYHRARPTLVALNRVARLASAMLVVLAFRSCFRDGSCVASMHQETSRSSISPTISFLRTMLLLSMTLHTIIYTSYLRFQFKTQLLFQTAHLALLVFCNSAGTATILSETQITSPAASICHFVNDAASFVIAQAAGIPPAPTSVCDTALAPWLLVVLAQFLLGFLVPLSIAYLFERGTKYTFLRDELRLLHFGQCSVWSAVGNAAAGVLLLLSYSVAAWLLLLQHHRSLLPWVLPWDWPGAHSGWYHELAAK